MTIKDERRNLADVWHVLSLNNERSCVTEVEKEHEMTPNELMYLECKFGEYVNFSRKLSKISHIWRVSSLQYGAGAKAP